MVIIADNLTEAMKNLETAKAAYQKAMLAVRSRFDEGDHVTEIERQKLSVMEKAVDRAKLEVIHYQNKASGRPTFAPIYPGAGKCR